MTDSIILRPAAVLLEGRFAEAELLIEDGIVVAIRPRGEAAPKGGARLVELPSARVIPGFFDIHTHGAVGVDFNLATAEEAARAIRFYASRGVTSCLPTVLTDDPETMARQLDILSSPGLLEDCPEIEGIHLEGPFLSPAYRGAQPERFLRSCDLGLFRELQAAARGRIRLVTMAPELPGALPFVRALADSGVRVSIGHSAASYEAAMAAIEAGAASATHAMNAMKLLHMHDPAILTAVLESDIFAEMICDGIHLHPPIVRLLLKTKGLGRMIAVTDSLMAAGLPDGRYTLGVNDIVVVDGDAKVVPGGARAGSTLDMLKALRNLLAFTGLDLGEASALVSGNPARLLGLDGKTGTLAAGKRADLVALDGEMNVELTMARGSISWPRG